MAHSVLLCPGKKAVRRTRAIFKALVQILYATQDRGAGKVSEDCAILIKDVLAGQTNIQLKFKFDGKWLYASVIQDDVTAPVILIGTDY